MENVSLAAQSHAIRFLKGMRPLFYVEPPSQSCFQNVEDVPDYLEKVGPKPLLLLQIYMAETTSWSPCTESIWFGIELRYMKMD